MPRIAPTTKIREEITRLLRDGVPEGQDVVGTLLRLGAQRLAQERCSKDEATDFLGRDRYVRHRGVEPHRGYRNGYEPGRVRTAPSPDLTIGTAPVAIRKRIYQGAIKAGYNVESF